MNENLKNFIADVKKGTKSFGDTIAAIVNSALLSFVYFIGVGLTAIFAKIAGKHFLDLKLEKEKKSYWEELNLNRKPLEEYYRQF